MSSFHVSFFFAAQKTFRCHQRPRLRWPRISDAAEQKERSLLLAKLTAVWLSLSCLMLIHAADCSTMLTVLCCSGFDTSNMYMQTGQSMLAAT